MNTLASPEPPHEIVGADNPATMMVLGSDNTDNGSTNGKANRVIFRRQPSAGEGQNIITDRKRRMSKRFSIKLSTEQNNETDEHSFYGPYRHLKKEMDYEYHRYVRS